MESLLILHLLLFCAAGVSAGRWDTINTQLGQILFRGLPEMSSNRICSASCISACGASHAADGVKSVEECWIGSDDGQCGCDLNCLRLEANCNDLGACGSSVEDCGWSEFTKQIEVELAGSTYKIGDVVAKGVFWLDRLECQCVLP